MRSIANDDDPEDEEVYEADPALSYDEENPDDEKSEVEATMLKSINPYSKFLGGEVDWGGETTKRGC